MLGLVLIAFTSSLFAGYSSGGRSGFSGGSRSFSSSRSYSSVGRSGYSRSTNTRAYVAPRTYVAPRSSYSRSYSGTSSNTVIHNNHYSHGGSGWGFGGGFFSGMLGGYLGSSLANNHHTTVVAGTAAGTEVIPQGQGMLVEGENYTSSSYSVFPMIIGFTCFIVIVLAGIWVFVSMTRDDRHYRNRW